MNPFILFVNHIGQKCVDFNARQGSDAEDDEICVIFGNNKQIAQDLQKKKFKTYTTAILRKPIEEGKTEMPSLFMNESQSKVEEFGKPWKTRSVSQKNAELERFIERVRKVEKKFPYGHVSMLFVTPLRTEKLGIDDFFDGCAYFVEAKYVGSPTNLRHKSKSVNTLQRPILVYREKISQADVEACGSDICKGKCDVLREKIFNRRNQLVKTLSERLEDKNVLAYVANDLLVERYLQAWGFGIGMPWEDFDREGKINRRIKKK